MNPYKKPDLLHLVMALEAVLLAAFLFCLTPVGRSLQTTAPAEQEEQKKYIKWVEFTVTKDAMYQAFRYDVDTCQEEIHLNWIELLAYLGAKYGGDFSRYQAADMEKLVSKLQEGQTMEELTGDMKYYSYYLEAYTAVLGGMVGEFEIQVAKKDAPEAAVRNAAGETGNEENAAGQTANEETVAGQTGSEISEDGENQKNGENPNKEDPEKVWVRKYGLKAFSPIARYFPYEDYDDFGASRSYGYKRPHLGHDMMGQVGTPIIAVESGYVEAIGWNQYGGWRLGIRSFDKKRYYYYAHLRKNYPYHKSLKEGSIVQAGDVIGYMGRTGYSQTENTNNIEVSHLHFGLQLIFDESQKEGNNEIWIDCYELVKFLALNRSETVKNQETKEYNRVYEMREPQSANVP